MREETYTPFEGKVIELRVPTRVLRQFHKPGHHAEIRERRIAQFRALEWSLVVDDELLESRMYHGGRLPLYPNELADCAADLIKGGWVEDPTARAEVIS